MSSPVRPLIETATTRRRRTRSVLYERAAAAVLAYRERGRRELAGVLGRAFASALPALPAARAGPTAESGARPRPPAAANARGGQPWPGRRDDAGGAHARRPAGRRARRALGARPHW